jgi:hypothetical protein
MSWSSITITRGADVDANVSLRATSRFARAGTRADGARSIPLAP